MEGVCESFQDSVQNLLEVEGCSTDVAACFDECEDTFSLLQTEYKQATVWISCKFLQGHDIYV